MFDGLLEVIGLIASLIGIWEFVSRRDSARRLAGRISQMFSKKTGASRGTHVDPSLVNRIVLFDAGGIAETNMNRHVFAGSYRRKIHIVPGNHDIDVVTSLR